MAKIILNHGGYRKLLSYQKSEIVYDGTVYFCNKYIAYNDRTKDQMIQAARSCKQNIVEGSMASGTSKETELKLTNVARASLEELLEDYKDYARLHKLNLWDKDNKLYKRLSELIKVPDGNYQTFQKAIENQDIEIVVNTMINLSNVTKYLLEKQINWLEQDFINHGGIRERMTKARLEERNKPHNN